MKNLEVLRVDNFEELTGLGEFPKLKELSCYGCKYLKDYGLIRLLKCAPNLELLDIRNCENVTNSVIDVAIKETEKRTNNIVLEIRINGTEININESYVYMTPLMQHLLYLNLME